MARRQGSGPTGVRRTRGRHPLLRNNRGCAPRGKGGRAAGGPLRERRPLSVSHGFPRSGPSTSRSTAGRNRRVASSGNSAGDTDNPCRRVTLDLLVNKSGRVWHCRLSTTEVGDAVHYAYAVAGPNAPGPGHRFDGDKILFDLYARALVLPARVQPRGRRAPGSNAGRARSPPVPHGRQIPSTGPVIAERCTRPTW